MRKTLAQLKEEAQKRLKVIYSVIDNFSAYIFCTIGVIMSPYAKEYFQAFRGGLTYTPSSSIHFSFNSTFIMALVLSIILTFYFEFGGSKSGKMQVKNIIKRAARSLMIGMMWYTLVK